MRVKCATLAWHALQAALASEAPAAVDGRHSPEGSSLRSAPAVQTEGD